MYDLLFMHWINQMILLDAFSSQGTIKGNSDQNSSKARSDDHNNDNK